MSTRPNTERGEQIAAAEAVWSVAVPAARHCETRRAMRRAGRAVAATTCARQPIPSAAHNIAAAVVTAVVTGAVSMPPTIPSTTLRRDFPAS
jgi:ribosomal protein L32